MPKVRQKPDFSDEVWRRERDSNPRTNFSVYSLSRGAPWTSWVSLQTLKDYSIIKGIMSIKSIFFDKTYFTKIYNANINNDV